MIPKVCLNMIVKNEAKNLPRLFESLKDIIDDYVIIDTGSTDNTKEVIKEYWDNLKIKGHVETIPFKNFAYNRTEGLKLARKKSKSDFILLLDADMILVNQGFKKEQLIGKQVITIKQKNQFIEWSNVRFISRKIDATCVGVTHEYYDTKNGINDELNTLYIQDIGDGGCKEDKFERDIRLLEQGIKDEPKNNRYYFYLAQSYRDTNNLDKAIEYYKKHIEMPGWDEEIWYSHYMISTLYLRKNMVKEAEEWALKGFIYRPRRPEALYAMCKFFREKGENHKAYHYYNLAKSLPDPRDDKLFVETKVYDHELDYENSIINFYIPWADKQQGIRSGLKVINKNFDDTRERLTLKNIGFYLKSLKESKDFTSEALEQKEIQVDGVKYYAASPSVFKNKDLKICNIRYVSYWIQVSPTVFHNDKDGLIRTLNYVYNFNTKQFKRMEEVIVYPDKHEKINGYIRGLEDVRIFEQDGKLRFIGQSGDYKNKGSNIRFNMVLGTYDYENSKLLIEQVLESPYGCPVEKNWVHLKNDDFIYRWFPLEIGKLKDTKFILEKSRNMPSLFRHMKGSSCAYEYKNMLWLIAHYTTDDWINGQLYRQYKHCLVILDMDYNLVAYSDPFTFEGDVVEYSLGMIIENNKLIACYSKRDKDGSIGAIDLSYFMDKLIILNKDLFYKNIIK